MEEVILVDSRDNEIGTMEKLEAHEKGLLHRAFSVILFNKNGDLLIQKRANHKYHSGGLWTNTCCSHPRPGESLKEATKRRLMEEMGISFQPEYAYKFIYKVALDHGMTEHELDHVYLGEFEGSPNINPEEVAEWKYIPLKDLKSDISSNPNAYTSWFKILVEKMS